MRKIVTNTTDSLSHYRSFDQEIIELWRSRGLKVVRETVISEDGTIKWVITAEEMKKGEKVK